MALRDLNYGELQNQPQTDHLLEKFETERADGELRSHQLKSYFRELEEYKSRRVENSLGEIIPSLDVKRAQKK